LLLTCVRFDKPTSPTSREEKLHVDFLNVGHVDAALTLITSPTGKTVLSDGGLAEASPSIVLALRSRNACPLDLILLTHRHADHLGGLVHVIESCGTHLAAFAHRGWISAAKKTI
jgi:beta-lactamase superfamily II metal-dependent hydrolase